MARTELRTAEQARAIWEAAYERALGEGHPRPFDVADERIKDIRIVRR